MKLSIKVAKEMSENYLHTYLFNCIMIGSFIPLKKFFLFFDLNLLIFLFAHKYHGCDFWTHYVGQTASYSGLGGLAAAFIQFIMAVAFIHAKQSDESKQKLI